MSGASPPPALPGICLHHWPVPPGAPPACASVLIVHGLGEHGGRYAALAADLNAWGLDVWAHDHHGHGRSAGARGALPTDNHYVADVIALLGQLRLYLPQGRPLLLLGHSMGGLMAALAVAQHPEAVDGLILSSPALAVSLSGPQRLLLSVLPALLPNLRAGNGLDVNGISHDPATITAYLQDPLVHDRVSARLAACLARGGHEVLAAAAGWRVPTLLLVAGADRLVDPRGARQFAAQAPAAVVTTHVFEALFHELFNEAPPDRATVLQALQAWLQVRGWATTPESACSSQNPGLSA